MAVRRGGSGLRASAADAAAAWRTEVAEQQQDLSDLQRPQQEALLAQQPLVVDRGLALALDGALVRDAQLFALVPLLS